MVAGLDKYREALANFTDNYGIISGTCCDIALSDSSTQQINVAQGQCG